MQYCTRRIPSRGGHSRRAPRRRVLRLQRPGIGTRAGVGLAQPSKSTATGGVPWAKSGRGPSYGRRGTWKTPTGERSGGPCAGWSPEAARRLRSKSRRWPSGCVRPLRLASLRGRICQLRRFVLLDGWGFVARLELGALGTSPLESAALGEARGGLRRLGMLVRLSTGYSG